MAINSELDAVLVAVRRTLDLRDDAEERIRLCKEEISAREQILNDLSSSVTGLEERLKELALRAGYLSKEDISEGFDLDSLGALVEEQIAASKDSSLPDNVFEFVPRTVSVPSERPEPDEVVQEDSLEDAVRAVLASLTKREELVVKTIFGIDTEKGKELSGRQVFYQRYVAEVLGWSPSTISRVFRKAMRKLRHPSQSARLMHHLDQLRDSHIDTREGNLLRAIFGEPPHY